MFVFFRREESKAGIYEYFFDMDDAYGLEYVNTAPDAGMAAQAFEFDQMRCGSARRIREEGPEYLAFTFGYEDREACDAVMKDLRERIAGLFSFLCVYCRVDERKVRVVFNTTDRKGRPFSEAEERALVGMM